MKEDKRADFGTPSISFESDTDTGLYWTSGHVNIATNGVKFLKPGELYKKGKQEADPLKGFKVVDDPALILADEYCRRYHKAMRRSRIWSHIAIGFLLIAIIALSLLFIHEINLP